MRSSNLHRPAPRFAPRALLLAGFLWGSAQARAEASGSARERFEQMSPEHKAQLRERLAALKTMPPAERAHLEANFAQLHNLSAEEKARVHAAWQRVSELPPDEQARLRARAAQVAKLPPEARRQAQRELRREALGTGAERRGGEAKPPAHRERRTDERMERREAVREHRRHR